MTTVRSTRSDVRVGEDATAQLDDLAGHIDRHSTAFCTTHAWLVSAARHLNAQPVVIVVREGDRPVGVAALAVTSRRGAQRVEILGGDQNDYAQFYCDDERAAMTVAGAVAAWLHDQGRWSLRFEQLAEDDPVLAELRRLLPGATVEPGPPMPQIRGLGTDYRISKNRRGQERQATNRITGDGRAWEKIVVADEDSLERWLPAVIALRRRRDHASGRRSHLDDVARLAFYEAVVRDFVTRGRAVINLLTVDGAVAGYHLTMLDGDTHRMLDGRVADELQRYRGGMVTSMMAMTAAAESPEVTTYDWLRGRTESKFGNYEQHRVVLRAASHRLVTAVDEWEASARRRVKAALPAAAVRRLVAR